MRLQRVGRNRRERETDHDAEHASQKGKFIGYTIISIVAAIEIALLTWYGVTVGILPR